MTAHSSVTNTHPGRGAAILRGLVALVFVLSLAGLQPTEPAQAAPEAPAAQADNCGVISLKATADTWMRESADTNNYGSDQSLSVDAYSYSQSALVKWDLSGLPTGATISAASLTLNVIDSYDTSGTSLGLYYVKRNWVEGTNNGASGTGASYTYYGAGTGSWSSGGANDTTNDRSSTSMWGATTIALGSQTFALNATGLTAVQNWYAGSLSNYGVTIQNQSGDTQDYLVFDSREGARPPLLNLTYCVGSPAIGDLVWDDADGDGIQDEGETGHAGVTVDLRKKSDNSLVASTTTNSAGLFSFSNPASDTYFLQFTAPAGYSFTLADQGSDDTLDSDAGSSGKTGDIVWTQGGTASVKWDAGLSRSCTTVTSRVSQSSDDAQQSGTSVTTNGTTLPISSSSLLWGARFQNVIVPNSATIASAALTFRSSSAQSGSNGVRTLYGQAADNPGTFSSSTSNDISGRTRTTASVIWNIASIYANTDFQSYLITTIVQEIVNRAGWAANNAMVILGPTTGTNTRTAYSYDGSSTYAPLLTVTYCVANPVPTITTSGTLSAFNSAVGTPSAEQSYTVSGANLTANLVITAPADFQISTTSGSGFGSTVSLTPSGGSVPSTTIYVRLNPTSATIYSANITHTSTGATTKNVAVSGSSVPTITVTSSMTAFSAAVGVYSAEQFYTVSGINLTANIVITPPADFEISKATGSGFVANPSTLTLSPASGVVSATTIYTRFKRATAGTSTDNITHTSTGATGVDLAVSGTASVYYTLTVNAGSGGTVALNPTGGSYASGTNVTLTATGNTGYIFYGWAGDLSGNANPATITMDGNKAVTAEFVAGTCTTVNLTAAEDTYLSANDVTYNNGGNTAIHVNGTTGTSRRTALLKWDISSIPSTATVSAATISLYVTDASTAAYNLYNMRRTWVEGTSSQAASSTSANWNTWDGANSWGTVGAANTSSDRYDTNLWVAGTTTFNSTGSKTAALNTDGVAVVQGWIAGTTSNYGLIIQNYSGSSNTLYFSSSEATTAANRPILNVTYCALSYTPDKPKPPVVTSIGLSGSNDVDLGWDAVTEDVNDHATTIARYQVYASHDPFFEPGVSDLLGTPTPPWALTFTHTGGSTGTVNWYYLVRAHNIAGESVDSVRRTGRFGFALVPGTTTP